VVAVRQRLKEVVKRVLQRYARRLLYVAVGALTDVDLAEDLRLGRSNGAPAPAG
jgi:hypothetical protein